MTGCTASRFGDHDYSQAPHNTPDIPRDAAARSRCQAGFRGCEDERRYEAVTYQPGTHEWVRMFTCVPCAARLRELHGVFGDSAFGIARITSVPEEVPA